MVTLPEPLHPFNSETNQEVRKMCIPTCSADTPHAGRPLPPDATALEEAFENSHDCITFLDMQGSVLFMNLPGLWQMELESDPATNRLAWPELWSHECSDLAEYSIESARSGRACRFTARRLTWRGAVKWWDVAVSPIFDGRGCPVQVFCVSRDVTELKTRESALLRALEEKEMLLSEVNHRIKNGLAAVASVLSLQARHSHDATVHNCLQEAQSRILAVAEIHRRLCEISGHNSLDIGNCITDVARGTMTALDASVDIELRTACEHGVSLQADRAITLALLTSELITNCVKHAFADGHGVVEIELASSATQLFLRVHDNGRGLPIDFDPNNHGGIGMKIVLSLVRQLRGELRIGKAGPGAHFNIVVPRELRTEKG